MSGINRLAVNNLRFQSPMEDRDGKINVRQGINTSSSSSSNTNNLSSSNATTLNSSLNVGGNNNNTSSSKAVLAALRALQDKIRRLEAEKTQAQDETKQLRLQIQNQEIEFDHSKQKEKLNLQKNLHEIRSSYDSVLNEKNELDLRVSKLDERNKDLRLQSEELYDQIQAIENEKHQLEYKYKDLESKYLQLEVQMDRAQQRERDLNLSMTKEARENEDERMKLVIQLDKVRDQLEHTARDKGFHDKRLVELDELVMQLLNLNEVLVSKLTESNTSNLVYKKILGIPKKSITPTVSQDSVKTNVRSATRTTSSSGGGRQSQRDNRERDPYPQDEGPEIDEDVARLNTLHKMYKGLAKSILEPRYGTEGYGMGSTTNMNNGHIRDNTTMNMSSLHQASIATNNLLSNKKKKSANSNGKMNNSNTDSNKTTSLFGQSSNSTSGGLQFNSSYDNGDNLSAISLAAELRGSGGGSVMGSPLRRSSGSGNNEYENGITGVRSPYASLHSPLRNTGGSGSGSSSAVDLNHIISTSTNPPLQKVISSLQDEFDSLSTQYRRILLSMQRDPAAMDPNLAGGTTIQHSDELISVIQQLQRKGEQLRTLKASL